MRMRICMRMCTWPGLGGPSAQPRKDLLLFTSYCSLLTHLLILTYLQEWEVLISRGPALGAMGQGAGEAGQGAGASEQWVTVRQGVLVRWSRGARETTLRLPSPL